MKLLCISLILGFFSIEAKALEAVVTVLEAPLFKSKSLDAPVVQYLRKGDILKVHPSLENSDKYNHLAPTPRKLSEIRKQMRQTPEWKEDPTFRGEEANTANLNEEFIPTLDRQGREVYILSEHIYVYFNTSKEFTQIPHRKDLTDYRLQEPLPKNYPLKTLTGVRGIFFAGFTQPYVESYPYRSDAKTKGYMNPLDLNLAFLKRTTLDKQDRFFFGVGANLKYFKNTYTFIDRKVATEDWIKFGVGPYITYDAFKGEKNRVNLFGTINVYLLNQSNITMVDENDLSDTRLYRGYNFIPRIGAQYHRKSIFEEIDFVLGTSMEVEPTTTYRAQNGAKREGWWRHAGEDKFNSRPYFTLAMFIGLQSAY